jgi:hypothetical protein
MIDCENEPSKEINPIIHDLYLGMPKDSAMKVLRHHSSTGQIRSSKTFMPFESEFDLNGAIGEISINPSFNEANKLDQIQFEMCFKAWAPWNKQFFSERVVDALIAENDLWPAIKFNRKAASWISKYNGVRIEVTLRDEKYIRGKISH